MNRNKTFSVIGGFFALTAVVLGAFGAHALDTCFETHGTRAVWETAVDYQMWHALGLLLIALSRFSGRAAGVAMGCFCVGILLFSGSLYCLALNGPRWLGPVTPLGGMLLIVGWGALVVAVCKSPKKT